MKIEVTDSSGAIDTYDEKDYGPELNAELSMDLGGTLVIASVENKEIKALHALYAPGMWMKLEIVRDDDA